MSTLSRRVSLRLPQALIERLGIGRDSDVREHLERYVAILDSALASVDLTEAEAWLICDACNGTLFEPHTVSLLWATVDDAVRLNALDHKWGVDGPALVAKLRGLSYCQSLALVDAVERFWRAPDEPDRLRAVGLA